MKTSAAALSFLILVAALESPSHGAPAHEFQVDGFHRSADCCHSYTRRRLRCVFMINYTVTTSECSQPGVIFNTKRGQSFCADPSDARVQDCLKDMRLY
ncbi:C-C motif chemokine 23-like [Rhynchonycteris naso]